eukprot:442957_1
MATRFKVTSTVGDQIEFNSDPEDNQDMEDLHLHIHQGEITSVNYQSQQISIKLSGNNQKYTYFIDEIDITKILGKNTRLSNVDDICRDKRIENCQIVKQLISLLNVKKLGGDQKLSSLRLLNCFHHLITQHAKDQEFERMFDGYCNIESCIHMHNSQISDIIHCYFRHAYDIGYRLNQTQRDRLEIIEKNTEQNFWIPADSRKSMLSTIEKMKKRKKVWLSMDLTDKQRYWDCVDKYCSYLNDDEYVEMIYKNNILFWRNQMRLSRICVKNDRRFKSRFSKRYCSTSTDPKKGKVELENRKFYFGISYVYGYKDERKAQNAVTVCQRFAGLKEEMLQNDISQLAVEQFQTEIDKACLQDECYYRKSKFAFMPF